jgi:hypothetical protein
MRVYARRAKDKQLELDAAEIRIRATRRIGEMMAVQPKNTGAMGVGTKVRVDEKPTLAEFGIDDKRSQLRRQLSLDPQHRSDAGL